MPPDESAADASQPPRSQQGELQLFAQAAQVDEPLVPARMVNEWIYCPRLAFLEWGHGEWAGNADTAAGNRTHRATEDGRAPALPNPEDLGPDARLKTRRLHLASERLGLLAEIDVLEAEDGHVVPVDVKTGRRPHMAEGAYLPAGPGLRPEPAAPRRRLYLRGGRPLVRRQPRAGARAAHRGFGRHDAARRLRAQAVRRRRSTTRPSARAAPFFLSACPTR